MAKKPTITIGEEGAAFYYLIGQAITRWSFVEDGLFDVAAQSFGAKDRSALAAGYMAIENFRSKLAFADQTFAFAPHFTEFADEWGSLQQYIQERAVSRNKLAHSTTMIFMRADEGRRYAVLPGKPTTRLKKPSRGNPPAGALCVREIDFISQQIGLAGVRLLSLGLRLREMEDPYADHAQRDPSHRSLEQIASIMRFSIGDPPAQRGKGG